MTKSRILIIGDQPENLLARHMAGQAAVLEDVTATLHALIREHTAAPLPAGINPSPQFREKLALDRAMAQLFGDQPYRIHDRPEAAPQQFLHNHVILDGGRLVSAMREPADGAIDDGRNAPFDYWWIPETAYLPLRRDAANRPFDPRTVLSPAPPYYADWPSSNMAAKGDVDLAAITQARRDTTLDLLQKAARALAASGLGQARDWQPRFQTGGWDRAENPAYLQQAKVQALHEAMPEHAKRLDYLLLDEADLWLHADWAAIPVAGLITETGYLDMAMPDADTDPAGRLFSQITGISRRFLQSLRDTWLETPPDRLVSVFGVHQ